MKCGGCVRSVERTLLDQPGVQRADVNLVSRSAWLDLAAGEGSVDAVLESPGRSGLPGQGTFPGTPLGAVVPGRRCRVRAGGSNGDS